MWKVKSWTAVNAALYIFIWSLLFITYKVLTLPLSFIVLMFQEVWGRSFCRTIEKLVEVVQEYPTEVEHIYSPACVPLIRCAGCCGDENLECHPTQTTNVTMQVGWTRALRSLQCDEQANTLMSAKDTWVFFFIFIRAFDLLFTGMWRCFSTNATKNSSKMSYQP